jgi:hypothetical protein
MKKLKSLLLLTVLAVSANAAFAQTGFSFTGTLATSGDTFDVILDLSSTSTITLQTYGFGGGTNQALATILPGGTDPFLAIFSGVGPGATILTDGFSNPFGTSLDLSNYGSFGGCPPAGAPAIGGSPQCGDITMTLSGLAAGDYTIVLSDGLYIANAVFDNGTLGEGFTDFTAGQFCNLAINGADCPNTSGAYALDITGLPEGSTASPTPEPATLLSFATGLIGVCLRRRKTS